MHVMQRPTKLWEVRHRSTGDIATTRFPADLTELQFTPTGLSPTKVSQRVNTTQPKSTSHKQCAHKSTDVVRHVSCGLGKY